MQATVSEDNDEAEDANDYEYLLFTNPIHRGAKDHQVIKGMCVFVRGRGDHIGAKDQQVAKE